MFQQWIYELPLFAFHKEGAERNMRLAAISAAAPALL